jgi:hypothetical protein
VHEPLLPADSGNPAVARDAARALRRSGQAIPRAVVARETVSGAGVLRKTGAAAIGVQATDQPRITGVGIVGPLVAGTAFPRAPIGLTRAGTANAEVCAAAPGVVCAVAPLIGAAAEAIAIAIPGTIHRRVGRYALVRVPARFAGSGLAMVRRRVREPATGSGKDRPTTEQSAHEASP